MLRAFRLIEAFDADVPVEVDGVFFHFFCDLDRKRWRPVHTLGLYGHRSVLHGPEIIFPWTTANWRKSIERSGHAIKAERGSLVSIGQVRSAPIQTPFDTFEDADQRDRKLAYIVVRHADGRVEVARRPLLLLPTGAVAAHIEIGDYSAAYRGMITRLEQALGLEPDTLSELPLETLPKPSDTATMAFRRAYLALAEAADGGMEEEKAWACFGYMMARAEAEMQLLEPARRGVRWKDTTAQASSEHQRLSWERAEPLRAKAREVIADNPNISLTQCAKLVADAFGKDPRAIRRQIGTLFEKRPNGREYRPRRPENEGLTGG